MGKTRPWSGAEERILRSCWGRIEVREIAGRLNRSEEAVRVRAKRLRLGPITDCSKFTKRAVGELLRVRSQTVSKWIKAGWLRASYAKTEKRRGTKICQINPQDLLDFLREHPEQWDAARAGDIHRECNRRELLADKVRNRRLEGIEKRIIPQRLRPAFLLFVAEVAEQSRIEKPEITNWIEEKRRQDIKKRLPRQGMPWTPEEDDRLRSLFRRNDLTLRQIGMILGRTTDAVKHRVARIDVWGTGERRVS